MADEVGIAYTKWGGSRHWEATATRLGDDDFGTWLYIPRGTWWVRGDGARVAVPANSIQLVIPDVAWTPTFYDLTGVADEVRYTLYVDMITGCRWTGSTATMVDLDLDVVRHRDGTVELLDEDEFVEHQVLYGYPAEIVELAAAASQSVLDAVRHNEPPFDGVAAATWAARAGIDLGNAPRVVVGDGLDGDPGRDIGRGGTVQAHDEDP